MATARIISGAATLRRSLRAAASQFGRTTRLARAATEVAVLGLATYGSFWQTTTTAQIVRARRLAASTRRRWRHASATAAAALFDRTAGRTCDTTDRAMLGSAADGTALRAAGATRFTWATGFFRVAADRLLAGTTAMVLSAALGQLL